MKIEINAPKVRCLNANEKRVYQLLKQGVEPLEIARIMHISYGTSWAVNIHDVPITTVKGIISSIREKGWEIPVPAATDKEENTMGQGKNITHEQREEIRKLHSEGMDKKDIAQKMGISRNSVARNINLEEKVAPITKKDIPTTEKVTPITEKEPALAATNTSPDENITESIIQSSDDNVKEYPKDKHYFSADAIQAVYILIEARGIDLDTLSLRIAERVEEVKRMMEELEYRKYEFEKLCQDYEKMSEGV